MDTLDAKFLEKKFSHYSKKQILKGYLIIGRILKLSVYIKMCWEIITTIVMYVPSTSNYMKDLVYSIRKKWGILSEVDQDNVIAALTHLNKRGGIDKALSKYK